ncbi:hypothetical protein CMV_019584 [Castanea mollissima]|uniref:Uncharacterized protein n=1 Tax=Castanea mollissima TaxID=60419 RepID=A0A8J4VNI6_9ROSI|nr:hypothetical protein CMV_019584 [Castanea mollissima]
MELASLTQTNISLPFITTAANGPKHIDTTLRRTNLFKRLSSIIVFPLLSILVNICFFSLCEAIRLPLWYTFHEEHTSKLKEL